ncbi:MAG: sodium:solute symporter family protein [Pirellulales bacterium]|nr:sodium:solute symporter family protein [Pirellulales bacterium]
MKGLAAIDWLVIAAYLVGVTVIGFWSARRVQSATSFFITDRKFGTWFMMFLGLGSGTHADQAATVASKTFLVGVSGIWYQWIYLFLSPFYWLTMALVRRMRAVTVSDFFEQRYSHGVSLLYAALGILQLIVAIALMLRTTGAMVEAVSSGQIGFSVAIAVMTVLFVAYGVAGGLTSSVYTDVIQGTLTVVLSFLIFPFALVKLGGMAGLRQTIDDPAMFMMVTPGEITTFYIVVVAFNAFIGALTQPSCMLMGAGKTEFQVRLGALSGGVVKRICTIAWTLTGICAMAMYAGQEINVDQVYGLMARDLLPDVLPGLLGLFIASILASMMGACNALMVSSSALCVENVYRPFLVKNGSDYHYKTAGRVASVLVVVASVLFAYKMESILTGLEVFWKTAAMMGVALWVGMFWRRATAAGALAGTLAGTVVWLFTEPLFAGYGWDFNAHFARYLPSFMVLESKLSLPWQMLLYLGVSFLVLVVVSLFTKQTDPQRLDRFYACLRTPVSADEPETTPFRLPLGVEPAPRRVLIPHRDFEVPIPSAVSVIGFTGVSLLVVLLIVLAKWIFSLGQ